MGQVSFVKMLNVCYVVEGTLEVLGPLCDEPKKREALIYNRKRDPFIQSAYVLCSESRMPSGNRICLDCTTESHSCSFEDNDCKVKVQEKNQHVSLVVLCFKE